MFQYGQNFFSQQQQQQQQYTKSPQTPSKKMMQQQQYNASKYRPDDDIMMNNANNNNADGKKGSLSDFYNNANHGSTSKKGSTSSNGSWIKLDSSFGSGTFGNVPDDQPTPSTAAPGTPMPMKYSQAFGSSDSDVLAPPMIREEEQDVAAKKIAKKK